MWYLNFVYWVEKFFPRSIVELYRRLKSSFRRQRIECKRQTSYKKKIREIRKHNCPVNVLFFAINVNMWKYDFLFQALLKDADFSPKILVIPQVNNGREFMLSQLKIVYEHFLSKGYPVICSYNEDDDSYVDIGSLNADVIFLCYPYEHMVYDKYNIRHFDAKYLTCYVNYSFCCIPKQLSCASAFHQTLWRYYVECEKNYAQVKKFYDGRNCLVTGYPTADMFSSTIETGKDWKLKNPELKRLIWAPHYSIEGHDSYLQFSTFLLYSDLMLQLAKEYKDKVQFVFKPHPALKPSLYEHPNWGKEKTDAYYDKWVNGINTAYVDGDYVDLFKSSDAMVHDSGSFIIEYLYVQKPVMILGNYDIISQSNEVGKQAYTCHYEGKSEADIRAFIEDVVIGGVDLLKEKRLSFYQENLLPPNGTVTETIVSDLKKKLIKVKR